MSEGIWTASDVVVDDDGLLEINGTAQVYSKAGILDGDNGIATVRVNGGTWTATEPIFIGNYRYQGGMLEITSGEVITPLMVVGSVANNPFGKGILKLGGTLTTSDILWATGSFGEAQSEMIFQGGTLRLTADNRSLFYRSRQDGIYFESSGGTIDTQGFHIVIDPSARFKGPGGLTKTGSGSLRILNSNIYTGGTTVREGTLLVNSSVGATTVQSGADLSGDGYVSSITLESGAILAPGDGILTLRTDEIFWNDGGILQFELGDALCDRLSLTGWMFKNSNGTYAFEFLDAGMKAGQTYTLIQFGATQFLESDFSFINGGGFDGNFTQDGTSLRFTVTAVPEPGTVPLLIIGAVVLGGFGYRLRRREMQS